ncbi:TetR family transcriptional regulator [Herbihabitans rhizosphaerae]|uniref:TetR family transcriptional regulator n=1 Tax=Herbihabitans rhizosphaerae TaxID=1872711 RepID=A0A4Q7KGU3_9PSEU|nr:TetR/AcrR family transcriptional regulator [Herbihabitans rhizosphaerae]RZS34472.1 TetR family transcriptional regulator [Herbihabitans rhizosphaerae]
MTESPPLSGRKAQAARNDELIVAAARDVFVADPSAPIAKVAEQAGVGISALYRRYPSKEALLHKLCSDGLATYIAIVEDAVADQGDPWQAFETFMRRVVEADTHSITIALAGTFTPSKELYELAVGSGKLNAELMRRTLQAGVIRPDVSDADLGVIFEQIASIHTPDAARTGELRQRYLTLLLDGLRLPPTTTPLPGHAPTLDERAGRWIART